MANYDSVGMLYLFDGEGRVVKEHKDIFDPEYFDRYIRDEKHLETVINYIDNNPVKAGLVDEAHKWPWCSLGQQAAQL